VISSFAKKLVDIKKQSTLNTKITVGNTEVVRDFVDVRDVAQAYYLLLKEGSKGEIYNICSGVGHSLKDLLLQMMDLLQMKVEMVTDPELIRPGENKFIVGSNKKIANEVGWKPKILIQDSLKDILDYWMQKS
jgi:GDP-4-dehydro-6-deoxy-D-mannose reductase